MHALLAGMNLLRYYVVAGSENWSNEFYRLMNLQTAIHAHDMTRTIWISMTMTDDSEQYTYDLRINRERGFHLTVNGKPFRRTPEDVKRMKEIWFFSPVRSPVQYTTRVQPTAGVLQPLNPDGSNVINYLLGRWTDQDPLWKTAESWLKKIDPDMSIIKTPIKGSNVSLETTFGNVSVNISMQGSGFQSATAIIPAVIFSPEGSTIIIEEPEAFLHPESQEAIIDMINDAVNNHNKQVIFSTHSFNILLLFYKDVGLDGKGRSAEHVSADPNKFGMWIFKKTAGKISIESYPIQNKSFQHFREDFKYIWG